VDVVGANTLTVDGNGATIDGSSSVSIATDHSRHLFVYSAGEYKHL